MSYIGNNYNTQQFTPAVDYFSGNGSTVTFTLSRNIASVAQVICAIDNVIQNPSSAFTVSGNSITFTSAPLSGTNNIWVEYTSLITTYAAISQSPSVIGDITASGGYLAVGSFGNSFIDGTVVDYVTGNGRITVGPSDGFTLYNGGTSARTALLTLDSSGNFTNNATGYTQIASGTTAQRPGSPTNGMIRYNSTLSSNEIYQAGSWNQFAFSYPVSYLVVAGGGGGGNNMGGGGGAGGLITGTTALVSGILYNVTVGAGGAGATSTANGISGSNSIGLSLTAIGGGGGGSYNGSVGLSGSSGGSGGGGDGGTGATSGGAGTSGQGNTGGSSVGAGAAGGGGGATAVGTNGTGAVIAGAGGAGLASSITGSSVTYAGGGGGGSQSAGNGGTGGTGGGGAGGGGSGAAGTSGTANTGGGGGGGANVSGNGGAGGSGVIIISVPTANYTGTTTGSPTVTTSGTNTIIKFTSSGSYTA